MQLSIRSNLYHNILIFLSLITLFSIVSLLAANSVFFFSNDIYRGVAISDIPLGGLSVADAEKKIQETVQKRLANPVIIITFNQQSWRIMADEINFSVNAHALADSAYQVGRQGNIIQQLQQRYGALNDHYELPLYVQYDQTKLYQIISNIAGEIDRQPKNASITLTSRGNVAIHKDLTGRRVDIARIMADAANQFAARMNVNMPLAVNEVMPTVVAGDFQDIDGLIATYTTNFNSSDQNRSYNIYLAAKSINEILLHPGDVFSFNQYVGPRLAQNGYREAPVFIDGELVPDWGGGVCQVSSTLYNAVLLADLSIEERTPHFGPPGYVPLGRDATVADNLIDFQFKNTAPTNIYLKSEVHDNQITISIFGKRNSVPEIRIASQREVIEPSTVRREDLQLEAGKEVIETNGQNGFIVTTYRIKYANGRELSREWLATDEFKPIDRVIRVGTKVL